MTWAPGDGDPGSHEWHRTIRGWHVAFGMLAALTGALFLLEDDIGPVARFAALGVLAALCGWYAATGARVLHRDPSRVGVVYIAGAMPLTVGLFAIAPVGALMLFLLYPHIWALLPIRRAMACTLLAVGATAGVTLVGTGLAPARLLDVFVPAAVGMIVALALGVWITRIIEQSRQRAQLVADLAATRAELATVSRRAGALAERERLARDIHDTLAQGFTSVLLLLEAAEAEQDPAMARHRVARARHTARENLAEARALIAELAPPALRDASLPDALRRLVDRIGPELGVAPALAVTGCPRRLPAEQEVVLLRVAQEALANVRKHATAGCVQVDLAYRETGVTLCVSDDGRGFDPAATTTGFGLIGMRERAAQVGGTVELCTAVGAGTTVRVELTA